jgi:energy-coupling factor transport system substrate-specific component
VTVDVLPDVCLGTAGVSAAYLRRFNLNHFWLIALGVIWGYLYGWTVNIFYWVSLIYPLTWRTFLVYQLNCVWLYTFHAIGNAVFLGVFGMKTIAILERFRKRFSRRLDTCDALTKAK